MNAIRSTLSAVLLCAAVLPSLSCTDSTTPISGVINVTVATLGASIDPDGYALSLDDGVAQPISVNGSLSFSGLAAGNHTVRLGGIEPNCTVSGSSTRTVAISESGNGSHVAIQFSVQCTAKPGSIRITSATSGVELDPDGYSVRFFALAGVTPPSTIQLPLNGTVDLTGLKAGNYAITLFGVAENCVVDGFTERTVSVAVGSSMEVPFVIRCVQSGGLAVKTVTTGVDLPTTAFFVELQLQGGGNLDVGVPANANGTVTFPKLLPGSYLMTVHEIAANCDPTLANPRLVTVVAGSISPIQVDVKCEVPRRIAFVFNEALRADIVIVNSNRTDAVQLTTNIAADTDPAWSPDGKKIAFTSQRDGNSEIYVMNADGSNQTRITTVASIDNRPAWSPNGAKIAFVSERDGNREIYVMNSDGTNATRLTTDGAIDGDPDWSPDGTRIAFRSDRDGASGIFVMNADGTGVRRLTSNSRPERQPAWSPDGTRIAFSRGVSANTRDIYVMKSDGTGVTQLTPGFEDAADPSWSPDGRKIAFGEISYYYGPEFYVISVTGVLYSAVTPLSPASNPAWRP